MADMTIRFKGHKTKKQYPNNLRRVVFYDHEGSRMKSVRHAVGMDNFTLNLKSNLQFVAIWQVRN